MRKGLVLTTIMLFATVAGLAQDATKSPGLSSLLDGAVRIYVVDESRCSANPNSKEGGRWYLIEGDEKLTSLRQALAEVTTQERGGCMCGGADIHSYAQKPNGETRYFGLYDQGCRGAARSMARPIGPPV